MVVAHHAGPSPDSPHVLFYGHYDVQPVDPIELWETDPFVPQVKEIEPGRKVITGRGSSDDKGQLMLFVEACRAWKAEHGQLPCRVSILFEGEEESGSPSLKPFLDANRDELKADFALVCDTDMFDRRDAVDLRRRCAGWSARKSPSRRPAATCIPACMAAPPPIRSASWRRSWPTFTTRTAASPFPASMTASTRRRRRS